MKKKLLKNISMLLVTMIVSSNCWATPASFEIWFLSAEKISQLQQFINQPIEMSEMLAFNDEECTPMGTGCFHPQYGYIEKNASPVQFKEIEGNTEVKTINNIEINSIKCETGSFFDIFCGKATNKINQISLEVWLDISSSLRIIDDSSDDNCQRAVFARKMQDLCKDKVSISIFNTTIKELGSSSYACMNYGMNNGEKLMVWINGSKAGHLIVVTDIDEYTTTFAEFITKNNGTMKGVGVSPIVAKDLQALADKLVAHCK